MIWFLWSYRRPEIQKKIKNVENYGSVMCLVSLYLLVLIHGLALYCLDGYILLIFGEAWNLLHNGLLPFWRLCEVTSGYTYHWVMWLWLPSWHFSLSVSFAYYIHMFQHLSTVPLKNHANTIEFLIHWYCVHKKHLYIF